MAKWSKALPLIAHCFSPLSGFKSQLGHVRKLPVTWGYLVVLAGYSGFLHHLQLGSQKLTAEKVMKMKILNLNNII